MDSIQDLTNRLLKFRDDRDWKQFHNPKDQLLSLCLEAAEALELVQWKNGEELQKHLDLNKTRLEEELADVLGWLLLIAHDQQIDLADATRRKIEKNQQKYPADQARGRADKYTAYQQSKNKS